MLETCSMCFQFSRHLCCLLSHDSWT